VDQLGFAYDEKSLSRLCQVDAAELMAAQAELTAETPVPFLFTIDGHHVPISPGATVARGSVSDIPLLIGTNSDENKLFRAMAWGPGQSEGPLNDRFRALFPRLSDEPAALNDLTEQLLGAYEGLAVNDDDVWDIVATDRMWRTPVQELIDACLNAGQAVFTYEFGLPSPVRRGELGACHALEIPFVFDNLHQLGVTELVGDDVGDGSVAKSVAVAMNAAWAAFAKEGRPAVAETGPWPAFDHASRQQMFFGAGAITAREDPHQARIAWWREHQHLARPAF
jgi:para-nitrobenzyl esterase